MSEMITDEEAEIAALAHVNVIRARLSPLGPMTIEEARAAPIWKDQVAATRAAIATVASRIAEREREECVKIADEALFCVKPYDVGAKIIAVTIRDRSDSNR